MHKIRTSSLIAKYSEDPMVGLLCGQYHGMRYIKMQQSTFVNLADAYLCTDCEAIGNSGSHCPRCQSTALIAISRAIPRHRDSIRLICIPAETQAQALEAA